MLNIIARNRKSVQIEERKGERNRTVLRLEVESRVIKIHPTAQTKGGMKMGEKRGLGVRKIWSERKIVSLSRSLNSNPLPP